VHAAASPAFSSFGSGFGNIHRCPEVPIELIHSGNMHMKLSLLANGSASKRSWPEGSLQPNARRLALGHVQSEPQRPFGEGSSYKDGVFLFNRFRMNSAPWLVEHGLSLLISASITIDFRSLETSTEWDTVIGRHERSVMPSLFRFCWCMGPLPCRRTTTCKSAKILPKLHQTKLTVSMVNKDAHLWMLMDVGKCCGSDADGLAFVRGTVPTI